MRLARTNSPDDSTTVVTGVVQPAPTAVAPGVVERFRAFYERMHGPARAFAERFVSDMEAEDAVQDAMAEVWIKWVTRGPEPLPNRRFIAIVRHKVRDRRRANRRLAYLDDALGQLEAQVFNASPQPSRGDSPGDVMDLAIAALPPKRREVFLLAHEHEYTYKEVGEVLRVSEGTVKTHLRLAVADVRETCAVAGYVVAPKPQKRLRPATDTGSPAND